MVRLEVQNHRAEVHLSAGSQLHEENKQEKAGAHWCSSDLLISKLSIERLPGGNQARWFSVVLTSPQDHEGCSEQSSSRGASI